eukprot:TRINITY_DN1417_c0_g2_i1.p1 TRINITY_DN1417_c0_g2~~TRINITY_DN1417_c0_g2_i1.p1  ORF type:complete len:423 (-),score=75.93 TRINITY_DN1417_c0_g2_i1:423-1691(-)
MDTNHNNHMSDDRADDEEWEEENTQQQPQQVMLLDQQGRPIGVLPASSLSQVQAGMGLPGMMNSQLPPRPRQPTAQPGPAQSNWTGLGRLPKATQDKFSEVLDQLKQRDLDSMRVLLIGKGGVGKSSTVNTVLNEKVSVVAAIAGNVTQQVSPFSRTAAGFTLSLIDTPGLMEADGLNYPVLEAIGRELQDGVDVVIYMDRLDDVLGEMDKMILEGLGDFFGPDFWNYVVVGFSFAGAWSQPIGNKSYEELVEERVQAMKKAVQSSGHTNVDVPCVLIDNSPDCPENEEHQKILATGQPWIETMMQTLVKVMLQQEDSYFYTPQITKKSNPNKKRKWLIPFVFGLQILFKVFIVDRLIEEDGWKGDQYGPYEPDFVKEERKRIQDEKRRKKQSQQQRSRTQRAQTSLPASSFQEEEEEFEED